MQTSELPDLAHTDTTPMHWLATAAAMAAVIAGAGLLQPGTATATAAGHRSAPQHGSPQAPAPDAAAAEYPMDCHGVGHTVTDRATGDLDGDGAPETVAVVRCAAGLGTPPSGVFVLTRGSGAAPRVVATLVDPALKQSATGLTVRDGVVGAVLHGYSSIDIPRCCPDEQESVTWKWQRDAFVRSVRVPAQSA